MPGIVLRRRQAPGIRWILIGFLRPAFLTNGAHGIARDARGLLYFRNMTLSYAQIEALFHKHRDELTRRLIGIVNSRDTAADLVQETYLRLLGLVNQQAIEHPRAFLFKTAANLAIDHQRKARYRTTINNDGENPIEIVDPTPSAETMVLNRQQIDLLMLAVGELPPKCREVFILHKFKHLSYADVGEQLGISRSTVVKHMVKALDHCKQRVEGVS
ncbi:MAG: sigma-70 family RNA polymerase sigma factor [Nitrospira sp.]